ncbi:MAG: hypothetical protein HKL80_11965 [Acidimicrobiales bacterium]|nr:hypothetical protein [Acidimicrobiales bacterium]
MSQGNNLDEPRSEEDLNEIPEGEPGNSPVPWHFKAFLVVTVIYLIYRAYQGTEWIIHHVRI